MSTLSKALLAFIMMTVFLNAAIAATEPMYVHVLPFKEVYTPLASQSFASRPSDLRLFEVVMAKNPRWVRSLGIYRANPTMTARDIPFILQAELILRLKNRANEFSELLQTDKPAAESVVFQLRDIAVHVDGGPYVVAEGELVWISSSPENITEKEVIYGVLTNVTTGSNYVEYETNHMDRKTIRIDKNVFPEVGPVLFAGLQVVRGFRWMDDQVRGVITSCSQFLIGVRTRISSEI